MKAKIIKFLELTDWRKLWNFLITAVCFYAAFEHPLWIVFKYKITGINYILNFIISVIFITDFIYHLNKKPYSKKNLYFALTVIPLNLLIDSGTLHENFIFLIFPRVIRLLSIAKFGNFIKKFTHNEFSHNGYLKLFYFMFWIFMVLHWVSCGWINITFEQSKELYNGDDLTIYVRSMYWAVTTFTTTGYGDIVPKSNIETVYTMFIMIIGAGTYGYVIGDIAQIMTNIDISKTHFIEKMDKMETFMEYRKLPHGLRENIRMYYKYLWEHRKGYSESDIVTDLPYSLQIKIALYLNKDIFEKIPLFKGANQELIHELATKLKSVIFTPGDYIFKKGDIGDTLYFITRGAVEISDPDLSNPLIATLSIGSFFGEIALLKSVPRTASAIAADYCDLYTLDKDTFDKAILKFPEFIKNIKDVAEHRKKYKDS